MSDVFEIGWLEEHSEPSVGARIGVSEDECQRFFEMVEY